MIPVVPEVPAVVVEEEPVVVVEDNTTPTNTEDEVTGIADGETESQEETGDENITEPDTVD